MLVEGTTENVTGSATTGNVTSGTASEAMIKAATAASSAESSSPGASGTGESPKPAGEGTSGATTDATGQPGSGKPSGDATGDRGPIPFDRHEAALRNAREEASKQHAWASELLKDAGLKPEEVKSAVSLLMRLRNDPAAFWKQLGEEVKAAGGTTEEETFEMPGADLATPDGKVKAFSESAMLKALEVQEKKILSQFKREMQPLIEFHAGEMTQRQQADFDRKAQAAGDAALARAVKLPHFKENQKAIAEKLSQTTPEVLAEIGPIAAMFEAYNAVLAEKVFPTIETDAEKRVRENFDKKAAGAGSVHPSGAGGDVKPVKLENVTDLAAHMEKLSATMA